MNVIGNIGAVGVNKDALPQELDDNALTDALNVGFAGGAVERVRGRALVGPTYSDEPHFLLPYTATGSRYVLEASLTKIWRNDLNTTRTDITRTLGAYTGTAQDRWTGGVLHGVAVLNNGVDVPQFYGGTGQFAALPNWPAGWLSKSIKPFRNYLLALNVSKGGTAYPYLVAWSHAADPGAVPDSWDQADPAKDAGEFPLSETAGAVVDGLALNDRFFVYKEDAIYAVDYIGPPNIFRFTKLTDAFGIFARNCIVNTPVGQVAFANGDVILNDGTAVRSLLANRMRRWLVSSVDVNNRALSFVTTNPKRQEVWVCFPLAGDDACTQALVWNWEDNTISLQSLTNVRHGAAAVVPQGAASAWSAATGTWEDQLGAWNSVDYGPTDPRLVLTSPTQLLAADQGVQFAGAAYTSRIERTGLSFGDPDSFKLLKSIRPRVEAKAGTVLTFRFASQADPSGAPTWSAAIPFTVGSDEVVYGFAAGRFLGYRVESNGNPWRIRSMTFDVAPMGKF